MKRPATLLLFAVLALFAGGCEMADREGFDPDPGVLPPEPPKQKTDEARPEEEAQVGPPGRPAVV